MTLFWYGHEMLVVPVLGAIWGVRLDIIMLGAQTLGAARSMLVRGSTVLK